MLSVKARIDLSDELSSQNSILFGLFVCHRRIKKAARLSFKAEVSAAAFAQQTQAGSALARDRRYA
jgi:hypothetical protein